jgi:hypothetical protein
MAREQWTVMLGENSGLLRLLGQLMPVCVCKMDALNFIHRQLTGKQMKNKVIRLTGGYYPSWQPPTAALSFHRIHLTIKLSKLLLRLFGEEPKESQKSQWNMYKEFLLLNLMYNV